MKGPSRLPTRFSVGSPKLLDYLLNLSHIDGGPKARFPMSFGFSDSAPDVLAAALLQHARPANFAGEARTPLGHRKLVYEGPILAPDKRSPNVRTVWRLMPDDTAELITAVPMTG